MKSKLLLLSVLCCIAWSAAFSTETEPNDTKAQANVLTLNASNTGAIGTATDVDWWKVTTNKDGLLSVTITINSIYCWVALYDNNGTTLLKNGYGLTTATITQDGLAVGSYFLEVYPFYPGQLPSYTISNSLTNAMYTNDAEPNDTKPDALTLGQNGTAKGHIGYYYKVKRDTFDWYKLTTNADGNLKLTLTSSNTQFVWCYLYDHDGTTLINSFYSNSSSTQYNDGLAAGTYYLMIKAYYPDGFTAYSVNDSLFPPALANDAEPNNNTSQALTINQNSTITGHVGYYYNLKRDTSDWYKIVTNADGMITFNLTSANLKFFWVYLYENDGTTLVNSGYTNQTYSYNTDGLAAGTYYVQVTCYYHGDWAPYTLTSSFTGYTYANDGLSNDFAKYAATLMSNNTTTGHVGFRVNTGGTSYDPIDWWKINYTGSGNLTVNMNFEGRKDGGGTAFIWLRIYQDTALAPIVNQNTNTGNMVAILTSLTKGYYYVAVLPYYTGQWTGYELTPTFTENCNVVTVKAKNKVSGTSCTNSSVKINCTNNNGPYKVQLYRNGSPYGALMTANGSGDVQYNNLPPGSYTGRGYADGATCGTLSSAAKLIPVPTNPTTSNITQTSVKLNWNTLTSCIEQSKVQYRVVGTTTWTNKKISNTNQNVTISNLPHNTSYEWQVASVDTIGGSSSTNVSAYVPGPNFTTLLKVGDDLNEQATSLNVYPNPASTNVHVSFVNGTEGEVTIKIFDVNGRIVFVQHQNEASGNVNNEIDLSSLNTGVYQLQIITADGSVLNQSIVKAKE